MNQIKQEVKDKYGDALPDMQSKAEGQEGSVLSDSSVGSSESYRKRRVLRSSSVSNDRRPSETGSPSVLNSTNQGNVDEIQIKSMLRRKLSETANDEGQSNMEIMIDQVLYHARSGAKWAIEYITDRLEGRPGTTQMDDLDAQKSDELLTDTIISHLNELTVDFKED